MGHVLSFCELKLRARVYSSQFWYPIDDVPRSGECLCAQLLKPRTPRERLYQEDTIRDVQMELDIRHRYYYE
jgi:hypothetical protein